MTKQQGDIARGQGDIAGGGQYKFLRLPSSISLPCSNRVLHNWDTRASPCVSSAASLHLLQLEFDNCRQLACKFGPNLGRKVHHLNFPANLHFLCFRAENEFPGQNEMDVKFLNFCSIRGALDNDL